MAHNQCIGGLPMEVNDAKLSGERMGRGRLSDKLTTAIPDECLVSGLAGLQKRRPLTGKARQWLSWWC